MSDSQKNPKSTVLDSINQQPTNKDILGDFFRHPEWADLFNKPEQVMTIKNNGIEKLPNLNRLINLALLDANDASHMDAPILKPHVIEITNMRDSNWAELIQTDVGTKNEKITLSIHLDAIKYSSSSALRAVISHEFGHENQPYIKNESNAHQQLDELAADRFAKYPLNMIVVLLTADSNKELYYTNDPNDDHPTTRDRIAAQLERAYGDGSFRFSGNFGKDHRFHPERQNEMPVTEEGYTITNWDNELAKKIKKLVLDDMQYLDTLVNSGVTTDKINQFIVREESRISEFRATLIFQVQQPTPQYIASHFAQSLKDNNKIEQVLAMHTSMTNVYGALYSSMKYADSHHFTKQQRTTFVNCVANNLIQGIRNGELLDNTNQSKIDAEMQNACDVK